MLEMQVHHQVHHEAGVKHGLEAMLAEYKSIYE